MMPDLRCSAHSDTPVARTLACMLTYQSRTEQQVDINNALETMRPNPPEWTQRYWVTLASQTSPAALERYGVPDAPGRRAWSEQAMRANLRIMARNLPSACRETLVADTLKLLPDNYPRNVVDVIGLAVPLCKKEEN